MPKSYLTQTTRELKVREDSKKKKMAWTRLFIHHSNLDGSHPYSALWMGDIFHQFFLIYFTTLVIEL